MGSHLRSSLCLKSYVGSSNLESSQKVLLAHVQCEQQRRVRSLPVTRSNEPQRGLPWVTNALNWLSLAPTGALYITRRHQRSALAAALTCCLFTQPFSSSCTTVTLDCFYSINATRISSHNSIKLTQLKLLNKTQTPQHKPTQLMQITKLSCS